MICEFQDTGTVSQLDKPISGFVDDYAFLIRGLIDLYEAGFDAQWLEWALELQEVQNQLFWDEVAHGYFTSPEGDPSIVLRLKEDQVKGCVVFLPYLTLLLSSDTTYGHLRDIKSLLVDL